MQVKNDRNVLFDLSNSIRTKIDRHNCMYSVRRSGDSYEALASASPRILQLHDNHDILQDADTS